MRLRCGVCVWSGTLKNRTKTYVGSDTPLCVHSKRLRVYQQQVHMYKHMWTSVSLESPPTTRLTQTTLKITECTQTFSHTYTCTYTHVHMYTHIHYTHMDTHVFIHKYIYTQVIINHQGHNHSWNGSVMCLCCVCCLCESVCCVSASDQHMCENKPQHMHMYSHIVCD